MPLTVALAFTMALLFIIGRLQGGDPQGVAYSPHPLAALTFLMAGAAIVPRRPRNAVGWLFLATGVTTGAVAISGAFAEARPMMWLNQWLPALAYGLLPPALLLFPEGRLPGRRWRPALWLSVAGIATATVAYAWATWIEPEILFDFSLRADGPAAEVFRIGKLGSALILAAALLAALSLGMRLRSEQGDVRQQVKLLALGATAIPAGIVLEIAALPWSDLLVATTVPLAAGAAVLKYRLYDIDLFINRSVVYSILTGALVLLYAVVATVTGSALGDFGSPLVATGAVALALQPLRARVQRAVGRLLYGHADDPYAAMRRVGEILEPAMAPETVFGRLAEAVADALRLPFVSVESLNQAGEYEAVVALGRRAVRPEEFPMVADGRLVGRLLASPRRLGGHFTSIEKALLVDLARQCGVAVHALRLNDELRAARARTVRSREDERLRLRRELHDGVGPALAGAAMQVDVARQTDSEGRNAALNRLASILQGCLGEVRQLVEGLRPPLLDELGLPEAIRRTAVGFAGTGTDLEIRVGESLEGHDLPAALEVAAYRIASEAVTNAMRHSGASRCTVRLELKGELIVEVVDDGHGMPQDWSAGVGTATMRERAEELGGRLWVSSGPSGTRVTARLPVDAR